MESIQHQMMGYDRAITMFSPDGRLLQVEYARRTVRLGNTALGIVCSDGVLLVTDKWLVDKLVVPEAVEKIFKIDEHIIATAAGILSDARVLVERGQVKAQEHKIQYSTPIDVISIVKDICNLKQYCTQSGGLRPFGLALLLAGIDESGLSLYETDPAGLYFRYKARVIGEGEQEAEEILHKEYRDDITVEEGLKLALKILKKTLNSNFKPERIDATVIYKENRQQVKIPKEKIEQMLK